MNKPFLGIPDDGTLFVGPTEYFDDLCKLADGNYSIFESILGFEDGHYRNGLGLIRIDIKPNPKFNIHIPNGNEIRTNNFWLPGGFTSGGMTEAVTTLIPNASEYVKITEIKGNY